MKKHTMRVLMAPWYDSNPYQPLLAESLSAQGMEIITWSADRFLYGAMFSGADVIHLHWLHNFYLSKRLIKRLINISAFVLQILIARALRKRIVWTAHNLHDHECQHPRMDHFCTWLVTRMATAIIVHCQWSGDELKKAFPSVSNNKIHIIPHGNYIGVYPQDCSRTDARRRFGLKDSDTIFLFFGAIRPYKGLPDLIAAFAELPPKTAAHLLIAGNPRDTNSVQMLGRATEGKAITMVLKSIDDNELQVFFQAADFHVLPYRSIATSGAAVLGMSFGKALIAPTLGCLTETLGTEGSILYDPLDPDGLRNALKLALDARVTSAEMGRTNFDTAIRWNWKQIGKQTADAYRAQRERD